jgi:hypothetical protein
MENSYRLVTASDNTALSIMTGFADYVNQGDEPAKSGVIRDKRLFPGIERNHWAETVDSADSLTE